jgi:hypothetical protein
MASSRKSSTSSLRSSHSSNRPSLSPRLSVDAMESSPPTPKRLPSAAYSTKTSSVSSALNLQLPPTPEIREDHSAPPPLPPKDFSSRVMPPKASTLYNKLPSAGPRPLKLTQSSAMLRSSSLTSYPAGEKAVVAPSSALSRPRTYSHPSAQQQVSISKLFTGLPRVAGKEGGGDLKTLQTSSVSTPSTPTTGVSMADASQGRRRSRIGTGMMYKRSASDSTTTIRPSLLAPSGGSGSIRRLRMPPSPLQAVAVVPSSPTGPGFGVEIGVAI